MTSPFAMPIPAYAAPEKAIHWWSWRRRARRLHYLEFVVQSEIRVSLDGTNRISANLESAYRAITAGGSADHVRGLAFADLLRLRTGCEHSDDVHEAIISMRLPMDVTL